MLRPCRSPEESFAGCGAGPRGRERALDPYRHRNPRRPRGIIEPKAVTRAPSGGREESAKPQLLFFYSRTSGSSRRAEGFLAQVLQRRGNHHSFRLRRIDVERHADLVERFRIEAVPALVVVADRAVRARLASPRGCAEIRDTLAPWLNG